MRHLIPFIFISFFFCAACSNFHEIKPTNLRVLDSIYDDRLTLTLRLIEPEYYIEYTIVNNSNREFSILKPVAGSTIERGLQIYDENNKDLTSRCSLNGLYTNSKKAYIHLAPYEKKEICDSLKFEESFCRLDEVEFISYRFASNIFISSTPVDSVVRFIVPKFSISSLKSDVVSAQIFFRSRKRS